jgi:hypothetical protein
MTRIFYPFREIKNDQNPKKISITYALIAKFRISVLSLYGRTSTPVSTSISTDS